MYAPVFRVMFTLQVLYEFLISRHATCPPICDFLPKGNFNTMFLLLLLLLLQLASTALTDLGLP
jgi:hypothetical protein